MEDRRRRGSHGERRTLALASRVSRAVVVVVVLAGVAIVVQRAVDVRAASSEGLPEVQAAIDRANEAYVEALKSRDARAYAALFTDDAVSTPARGSMLRGRDAIEASIAGAFRRMTFRNGALRTTETQVDGSVAYEIGRYTFDVETDGAAATLTGRYVVVWRRVGDGWKIAVDASQPGAVD